MNTQKHFSGILLWVCLLSACDSPEKHEKVADIPAASKTVNSLKENTKVFLQTEVFVEMEEAAEMPENLQGQINQACDKSTRITGKEYRIAGSRVNIRHGPGTEYDRVSLMDSGNAFISLNSNNIVIEECIKNGWSWVRVSKPGKQHQSHRGWVSSQYLEKGQKQTSLKSSDSKRKWNKGSAMQACMKAIKNRKLIPGGAEITGTGDTVFSKEQNIIEIKFFVQNMLGIDLPYKAVCHLKDNRPGDISIQ